MAWTPKSTSPVSFRLRDQFAALITGDATWGWLVDWLPYLPGDPVDTAAFCAAGPIAPPDLSPLLSASGPDRSPFSVLAKIATIGAAVGLAANDRVFQAYCENVHPLSGGYGDWIDVVVEGTSGSIVHDTLSTPGSTHAQVEILDGNWAGGTDGQINLTQVHFGGTTGDQNNYFHRVYNDVIPTGVGTIGTLTLGTWDSIRVQTINHAHMHVQIRFDASTVETHTATPQPNTDNVPASPVTGATLVDIAAETDRLEAKLDFLLSLTQFGLRIAPTFPDAGPGDPADVAPNTPTAIGEAVGLVITASGVPAGNDLAFGEPQEIADLGRINFGTAAAWYPSIPLTHTPMVIRPLPPGTTRYTVTGVPPSVTVQIAPILPAK
jgi:hypothetical protein